LINDLRGLFFDLGLYINLEPFLTISEPFGFPILLDIFRVSRSIVFQVVRMAIKPGFDPRIIVTAALRISLPPAGIVLFL